MDQPFPSRNGPGVRPVPRPPRTTAKAAQIQAQNRRREYLEQHPEYLANIDHEFADPVLHELLVRRFQTPAEREAEGKVKGYSRVLEGDLLRGEAKLATLAGQAATSGSADEPSANTWFNQETDLPSPKSREEGRERWKRFLTDRFVHGDDDDFDYSLVDGNEDYDVADRREGQDAWFDEEEPSWVDRDAPPATECDGEKPQGETGIQDF